MCSQKTKLLFSIPFTLESFYVAHFKLKWRSLKDYRITVWRLFKPFEPLGLNMIGEWVHFKSLSVCSPTYLSTLVCYDHNIQCANVIIASSWKETFLLRTSKMISDPKSTLIFKIEKKKSLPFLKSKMIIFPFPNIPQPFFGMWGWRQRKHPMKKRNNFEEKY